MVPQKKFAPFFFRSSAWKLHVLGSPATTSFFFLLVASCGLWHVPAHLMHSRAGKATVCVRSPIEFTRFCHLFSFFTFFFSSWLIKKIIFSIPFIHFPDPNYKSFCLFYIYITYLDIYGLTYHWFKLVFLIFHRYHRLGPIQNRYRPKVLWIWIQSTRISFHDIVWVQNWVIKKIIFQPSA